MRRAWGAGEHCVLRFTGNDNGWVIGYPQVVVEVTGERVVLYQPAGVVVRNVVVGPDRRAEAMGGASRPWPATYEPPMHVVRMIPRAAEHAVEVYLDAGDGRPDYLPWLSDHGYLRGWKVNLQARLRETEIGFDTTDNCLDVVADRERRWRWKDVEMTQARVEAGLTWPEEAARFRAEGERVIEQIERGEWPFTEEWESWRPKPAWGVPELPPGWERLPGYDVDLNRVEAASDG